MLPPEAMSASFSPLDLPGENQIQSLKLRSTEVARQVLQELSLHVLLPFRGSPLMAQDVVFPHVNVHGMRRGLKWKFSFLAYIPANYWEAILFSPQWKEKDSTQPSIHHLGMIEHPLQNMGYLPPTLLSSEASAIRKMARRSHLTSCALFRPHVVHLPLRLKVKPLKTSHFLSWLLERPKSIITSLW